MDDQNISLASIKEKIREGKVVLFLGAGATCSAGGPDSTKIIERLYSKFSNITPGITSFEDVCQEIVDTPEYGRRPLIRYLSEFLLSLAPSPEHLLLTDYLWRAIYTTNYDDLIEQSYRQKGKHSKIVVFNPDDRPRKVRNDDISLYKIMGSLINSSDIKDNLILTTEDRYNFFSDKSSSLMNLMDELVDGIILYIGYSFDDLIIYATSKKLINKNGLEATPFSYAVFRTEPDEKKKLKLANNKIKYIIGDFKNIINYFQTNIDKKTDDVNKDIWKLKVTNETVDLDNDFKKLMSDFIILNENLISEKKISMDLFFKGLSNNWNAYVEEWDFPRDLYIDDSFKRQNGDKPLTGSLKSRVFNELKLCDYRNNKIIYISGMPGSGKTILINRIAYDVYHELKYPVIIINNYRKIDYPSLFTFVTNLKSKINNNLYSFLFVLDDAATRLNEVNYIIDNLTDLKTPLIFLVSDRENMFILHDILYNEEDKNNIYVINEKLTEKEKERLPKHLIDKKIIKSDNVDLVQQDSFFATIYNFIHPARYPLDSIIRDQFIKLPQISQLTFKYICALQRFNINMPLELLVRVLNTNYNDIKKIIIDQEAKGIIYEDKIGKDIYYRTHHRIISEKTFLFFIYNLNDQTNLYKNLFININMNNEVEENLRDEILITNLSNTKSEYYLGEENLRYIYTEIYNSNPNSTILHHWGILETDNKNKSEEQLKIAENILKESLTLKSNEDPYNQKRESESNIRTSLGVLYKTYALYFFITDHKKALSLISKAETEFNNAKNSRISNINTYHTKAHMYYLLSLDSKVYEDKILYLTKAVKTINECKKYLYMDKKNLIKNLEIKIDIEINDLKDVDIDYIPYVNSLNAKFLSSDVYYIFAYKKQNNAALALSILDEGIKNYPNDEQLYELYINIYKIQQNKNLTHCYNILKNWYSNASSKQTNLLFEFACVSFILEKYNESKTYFKEISRYFNYRQFRHSQYYTDGNGINVVFNGLVIQKNDQYDGYVTCNNLKLLRDPIKYIPRDYPQIPKNKQINYNILFTAEGPLAFNISEIK